MSALVLIESSQGQVKSAALSALSATEQTGDKVHVLVVGTQAEQAAESLQVLACVEKVLVANSDVFDHGLAEPIAELVTDIAKNYQFITAAATTWGKNILPRVAACCDVMQISDIVQVVSADTFVRPIYAGNALETVQSEDIIKVVTIRATSFEPYTQTGSAAPIEMLSFTPTGRGAQFVRDETPTLVRPELTDATIVVSGGRGVGSKEQFALIEQLADKLNAAVGASRAAVDAGYVPNDYQVGQTGKIVAPQLYVAIGISGAIQHVAGIKDAKVIVAINQDSNAPIFEVADYGLVGDLFTIVPEIISKL